MFSYFSLHGVDDMPVFDTDRHGLGITLSGSSSIAARTALAATSGELPVECSTLGAVGGVGGYGITQYDLGNGLAFYGQGVGFPLDHLRRAEQYHLIGFIRRMGGYCIPASVQQGDRTAAALINHLL